MICVSCWYGIMSYASFNQSTGTSSEVMLCPLSLCLILLLSSDMCYCWWYIHSCWNYWFYSLFSRQCSQEGWAWKTELTIVLPASLSLATWSHPFGCLSVLLTTYPFVCLSVSLSHSRSGPLGIIFDNTETPMILSPRLRTSFSFDWLAWISCVGRPVKGETCV